MCISLCFTPPPPPLKVSLMSIYWCSQELSVSSWLSPFLHCFPVLLTMCISVWWNMNACPFSFCPLSFYHLPVVLAKCLSDELWMHVPSPSLQHLPSVSAVHRCGMKYRCLSLLGAVNAKCYLSITGEIMSVLSKYQGLYVVFWLMKGFSLKYTSSDQVNSWIPGNFSYFSWGLWNKCHWKHLNAYICCLPGNSQERPKSIY